MLAAVEFQRTHPNTLILVVGDHATGGLAIENVDSFDETGSGQSVEDGPFTIPGTTQRITVNWTTNQHTADSTPATASGPSSERFSGFIDNTDIFHGIVAAARLGQPATPELDASTVGGAVPATLSPTLGAPAAFAPFTPGVARGYTAATTATVISTASEATLTVSDPGHLTNGPFALAAPLRVAIEPGAWSAPVTNATAAITFKQAIGAGEPLRTGVYGKTLVFTLATTSP